MLMLFCTLESLESGRLIFWEEWGGGVLILLEVFMHLFKAYESKAPVCFFDSRYSKGQVTDRSRTMLALVQH